MKTALAYMFNPFERVGGALSLVWGLAGILFAGAVLYFGGWVFAGLLQIGFNPGSIAPHMVVICGFVVWLVPSSLFMLCGKAFSKSKVRAVDVYGMTAFAQIPFALMALLMFPECVSYTMSCILTGMSDPAAWIVKPEIIFGLSLITLSLFPLIWALVLMFQALKISCNLSGGRLWGSYLAGIVGGDVLSRAILYFLVFSAAMAPLDGLSKERSKADPELAGKFEGILKIPGKPLRFALEIGVADGEYTLTARSPDQGNTPIPISEFSVSASRLEFKIPQLNISYSGKFDPKKNRIRGTFFQGVRIPLVMERKPPEAKRPNFIDANFLGSYEGVLNFPGQKLRFVLELSEKDGNFSAKSFSPDQGGGAIPVEEFSFAFDGCRFAIEKLGIVFEGSADAKASIIKGRFTQHGYRTNLVLKKK